MIAWLRAQWLLFRHRDVIRRDAEAIAGASVAEWMERNPLPAPPPARTFHCDAWMLGGCAVCGEERVGTVTAHPDCWASLTYAEAAEINKRCGELHDAAFATAHPLERLLGWRSYGNT